MGFWFVPHHWVVLGLSAVATPGTQASSFPLVKMLTEGIGMNFAKTLAEQL